ncbi:hypothetical protein HYV86_01025 [Candidatus Woesearchaeota archaeon]|nr:hypothetical protein [Candidatus Woesearchaeota archaeon]
MHITRYNLHSVLEAYAAGNQPKTITFPHNREEYESGRYSFIFPAPSRYQAQVALFEYDLRRAGADRRLTHFFNFVESNNPQNEPNRFVGVFKGIFSCQVQDEERRLVQKELGMFSMIYKHMLREHDQQIHFEATASLEGELQRVESILLMGRTQRTFRDDPDGKERKWVIGQLKANSSLPLYDSNSPFTWLQ